MKQAYTFFNKYGGGGGSTGDDGPIAPVDKLTMSLTVNNVAERSFTKGYNVTLTLGNRRRVGRAGQIYDIDCGNEDKCKALGNVVLKFYLQPDQREDERNHLAKIDELKAVFDKNHNNC
ncbi:hypothetical protein CSPAE12_07942 [Colletotrichum incanum]|nr:hypothetical protein CSPAE12_07942 [Colletotrichum incanum]